MENDSQFDHQLSNSSANNDEREMDQREKTRRERISKANKGNVPWNKGRKHSPGLRLNICYAKMIRFLIVVQFMRRDLAEDPGADQASDAESQGDVM